MDIAVGATVAAVAKKVLVAFLGDKNGRKFLLYVVCITLFIVFIPLIALIGMFGWMSGDGGTMINKEIILQNLPSEQQEQLQSIDAVCETISSVFKTYDLESNDERKASTIYVSYLMGQETQDNFYDNLASCFLNTTEEKDVYELISETFLVDITDEDRSKLDSMYGITPTRVTEETTGEAVDSASPTHSS